MRGPTYRQVVLRVSVSGNPADLAGLGARLTRGLRRHLDPLVGGDRGKGWPFGDPLRPSALLRVAHQVAGSAARVVSVAIGVDGEEPTEDCRDVVIREHELVVLERLNLVAALPEGSVVTDPDIVASYRHDRAADPDAGTALAVVRPRRTEEVQTVLRWATANGIAVVPRGAGTGLSGGATALDGAIMLSTERMRDIAVDPATRTATYNPEYHVMRHYSGFIRRG